MGEANFGDFCILTGISIEKITLCCELRKSKPKIKFSFFQGWGVKWTFPITFVVWGSVCITLPALPFSALVYYNMFNKVSFL